MTTLAAPTAAWLEELFDTMAVIDGWFATLADYDAKRAEQ